MTYDLKLNVDDLVPMNAFVGDGVIKVDPVYAQKGHPDNHFPNLYDPEATLIWAHKDLAVITLVAAKLAKTLYGWSGLKINDCLRPVEAQEQMAKYGYHPSLVSRPGSGAHPRAMAIDVEAIGPDSHLIDMGTPFDHFVDDPEQGDNPAARNYTKFDVSLGRAQDIWLNRQRLEFCMRTAATRVGKKIDPLAQEWWDYRFFENDYRKFAPLREADLHPYQRLINPCHQEVRPIKAGTYPLQVWQAICEVTKQVEAAIGYNHEPNRSVRAPSGLPGGAANL